MNTTNTELLKKFYDHFVKGDFKTALELCSPEVTFQIAGQSKLAGKYTAATVVEGVWQKISALSQGTFKQEIHDIMGTDLHGMILTTNRIERNGSKHEYRSVHVWRIQQGKLVAWYEYPRDLYQYDVIWG